MRVTRREQAVGAPSARSLLLTILGEWVLPAGGSVWSTELVGALGALGVEETAARQALARTASGRDWLVSERVGRQVRWTLSPAGRRLLEAGAERIYTFGAPDDGWDGRWVLLFASVPEERREVRRQLRTRLGWAGFGAFGPGVWVSPTVAREWEAEALAGELGIDGATSFVASIGALGDPAEVVRQAWDLEALAADYEQFLGELEGWASADSPQDAFAACTRLVHAWRRFPLVDPALPSALLPSGWVGAEAHRRFHALHGRLRPVGQRWWAGVVARGSGSINPRA